MRFFFDKKLCQKVQPSVGLYHFVTYQIAHFHRSTFLEKISCLTELKVLLRAARRTTERLKAVSCKVICFRIRVSGQPCWNEVKSSSTKLFPAGFFFKLTGVVVARFLKGWVKLHRSIIENELFAEGYCFAVLGHLICMANYRKSKVTFDGQPTIVQPGQVLTSAVELAKNLKWSRARVSRRLTLLEKSETISVKKSSRGLLITLINWESYQGSDETDEHQPRIKTTSKRHQSDIKATSDEHQSDIKATLIEEGNKVRKKELRKKESNKVRISLCTDEDRRLAERWLAHALHMQPWLTPSLDKFAEGVSKLKKSVGLNDQQAEAVLDFIIKDEFWADKAISPASLLKRSSRNDLRKIDNILAKMKKPYDQKRKLEEWINSDTDSFNPFGEVK